MLFVTLWYQPGSHTVRCIHNNSQKSWNNEIVAIFQDANSHTYIQHDNSSNYRTIEEKNREDRLTAKLSSESIFIKLIWEYGMKLAINIWSK